MAKLKPGWVKTDIPKDIKIKLWWIMKDNPIYRSWEERIVGKSYTSAQDKLFANDELKYIKMSSDTYKALKYEILHMPAEEVVSLPPDLQSWVKQLRPELGSEKHPRRKVEVTSLTEKYLIDHYQKLHKVLEQFYDQFRAPELSELCLFTLEDRITVSHSYVSEMLVPAIIYGKGAIELDVEVSDPFLWGCLNKHLTAEFPVFSKNLGDWKKDITTIVEGCHDITKTIADKFTEMGAKMRWNSAEPYLSRDSKNYGPGVYHDLLASLIYECVTANHVPRFRRGYDSRELVMEYPRGRKAIARGDDSLLDQVEQCCLGIVSDSTIKEKAKQVLGLAKQAEATLEPIKQKLRLVLERGTFKETCSICSDLISQID